MGKNYDYTIYTDGGCISNPGGTGGCACVIIDQQTGELREFSEGYISSTNNRMEISAIILAIKNIPKGCSALIHSDSQYAINCASGIWARSKNVDLWNCFEQVSKNKKIDFKWVRGHNGDTYNERCDELATQAINGRNFLIDTGYGDSSIKQSAPQIKPKDSQVLNVKAFEVNIVVPDNVSMYCTKPKEEISIAPACRNAITELNHSKAPSFKRFAEIKTFGRDGYSKLKGDILKELCGKKEWDFIYSFFNDESRTTSAARWYLRGLNISHAIRKELVNQEIAANFY